MIVCMRTTLDLNPDLLQQAMRETRARSKTAVVEMGLEALLAIEARSPDLTVRVTFNELAKRELNDAVPYYGWPELGSAFHAL